MALNETTTLNPNSTADYENDPDIPLPTHITWISVVSFSITGIVGIALYIPIFAVIIVKREKFLANSFYKFLLALGVSEILQLFYYGPFSSFCLIRGWLLGVSGYCPVPLLFNYAFGAVSWISWFVEFFVHPLIAFDRLMAICFYSHYSIVLTPKNATAMCVIAWLGACVLAGPIIGGYLPVAYFISLLGSYFDNQYSSLQAYTTYNWFLMIYEDTIVVACALLYAICCGVLVVRRRRLVAKMTNKHKSEAGAVSTKAQRKLTIQAAVHFFWLAMCQIMYAVLGDVISIWLSFAMNMVELIICMNTTLVTLWLNDAVREELASWMRRKNTPEQAPTTMTQWATRRNK